MSVNYNILNKIAEKYSMNKLKLITIKFDNGQYRNKKYRAISKEKYFSHKNIKPFIANKLYYFINRYNFCTWDIIINGVSHFNYKFVYDNKEELIKLIRIMFFKDEFNSCKINQRKLFDLPRIKYSIKVEEVKTI